MSPSQDAKSIYSVQSHSSEVAESWGTVHTGSRTPTPTHTSAPPVYPQPPQLASRTAYAHRSNPSYPSPSYGPSSPLSSASVGSISSSLSGLSIGPGYAATPGAPVMGTVPLPHCSYVAEQKSVRSSSSWGTPAPQAASQLCPLLHYPSPFINFNLSQSLSSLSVRHGAVGSLSDIATAPALPSMFLKISFINPKINLPVSSRSGYPAVTVYDVFAALSSFMQSAPQNEAQIVSASQEAVVRGKTYSRARRARGDPRGTMWADFLGPNMYFGGLVKTSVENVYEVWFASHPGQA